MPNITAVNALGDFDIAADRLAIIDGECLSSLMKCAKGNIDPLSV
jgi:hypothetical protein